MQKNPSENTERRLKEVFDYDPETGIFTWKIALPPRGKVGKTAGWVGNGYIILNMNGERISAHRAAWWWMTGYWPTDQIDHINTKRADNRFVNLREATNAENNRNTPRRKSNTTGAKGVYFCQDTGRYRARIEALGTKIDLGRFDTVAQAAAAYAKAADKIHGQFARAD